MHSRIKSDAAFADVRLQRDAKVGALLACLAGVALPLVIARFFHFSHEDVGVQDDGFPILSVDKPGWRWVMHTASW